MNSEERDVITGLYGKDGFYREARMLIDTTENEYDIIAMDIERFKIINDNYGTEEGDRLLKYIADRMVTYTDSMNSAAMRMSADCFFIIVEHHEGFEEQFISYMRNEVNNYDLSMKVTVKFGIYKVEDKTISVAKMCNRALLAVEMIKGKYDVSFNYYDDSIRKKMELEQTITNDMESALANREFEVYFQPKYDLLTDKVAGAEALVRWKHPIRGMISPGIFIPIFERNGFVTKLDMFVWEETCKYISQWKQKGRVSIPVSVNVSRCDIYNTNLPQVLLELVGRYNINPDELHLEITETAYTEDSEQLIEVVSQLKMSGFIIEMDDFGSGYSSLNMISELPIDILKLDMRFVQSDNANNNKNIMNFVVGLAKWMNLLVVAEGVETQEQINSLKSIECNYVQGFFYSKPLPGNEFTQQLKDIEISPMINDSDKTRTKDEVVLRKGAGEKVILVVDGMQWNCDTIYEYFKSTYSVAYTGNAQNAINYIEDNYDKVVLVISELILKGMGGMEMLIKLKAEREFAKIPVIITAQLGQGGEEMALALGASDFILKPYSKGVMMRRVQNVLLQSSMKYGRDKENADNIANTNPSTGLIESSDASARIFGFMKSRKDAEATYVLISVQNLDKVKDICGHSKVCEVIEQFAAILKKSFRKDEIIYQSAPGEFAIFLPRKFADSEFDARLDELQKMLKCTVDNVDVYCAIGVSEYPAGGMNYQMLYQNAKIALMEAKASNVGKYKVFKYK